MDALFAAEHPLGPWPILSLATQAFETTPRPDFVPLKINAMNNMIKTPIARDKKQKSKKKRYSESHITRSKTTCTNDTYGRTPMGDGDVVTTGGKRCTRGKSMVLLTDNPRSKTCTRGNGKPATIIANKQRETSFGTVLPWNGIQTYDVIFNTFLCGIEMSACDPSESSGAMVIRLHNKYTQSTIIPNSLLVGINKSIVIDMHYDIIIKLIRSLPRPLTLTFYHEFLDDMNSCDEDLAQCWKPLCYQ